MSNTTKWIIAVAVLAVTACVCISVVCIAGAGLVFFQQNTRTEVVPVPQITEEQPLPTLVRPKISPTPRPTQDLKKTPAPTTPDSNTTSSTTANETLKILEGMIVPINDPVLLAESLKGIHDIPATVTPPSKPFKIGDHQKFWVTNTDTDENRQLDATLHYTTDHLYFWVEDGVKYNQSDMKKLSDTFETKIYPTDREFFGSEWTPGIDGDVHLYVLYASNLGSSLAGYFSSVDEVPPQAFKFSNAHEMFVMNSDNVALSDEYIYGTMAHEFQHMIHYKQDRNEESWMNEGFSVLAEKLNNYPIGGFDQLFIMNPDLPLTFWPDPKDAAPHYGASFMFLDYFLGRFGKDATKALVANQENGMDSIDAVLKDLKKTDADTGNQITADDVFADWTVANYLDDKGVAGGRYYYSDYPQAPKAAPTEQFDTCPVDSQPRSVSQYGANYFLINCTGKFKLNFKGNVEVPLLPNDPNSGQFMFWSNKGDESDMTLTHDFDFSKVSGAIHMTYSTWYDLEKGYDFVYLEESEDGVNWNMVKTPSGTDFNPSGNNYGWGYNNTTNNVWIKEDVDLSKYAGKKIQLRFEYITDAAVNGEGLMLDDISIPQINYQTDFEKDNGGWVDKGFVRVSNHLPQTFKVSVILSGKQTKVEHLDLNASQSGSLDLDLGLNSDYSEAILVVGGTTRFTNQKAGYQFSIEP
jgi:immune inhibitor A